MTDTNTEVSPTPATHPQNFIAVKNTLLELVISEEYIPLVDKDRFKAIRKKVEDVVSINDQHLEYEVLKAPLKISELHDILQYEAELLFQFKNILKRSENVWSRYFKGQLSDRHYATYGRQSETLTVADTKMAIEMRPEMKQLGLSIDRLSRIVKFLEDEINIVQFSFTKSIGDSIKLKIFLEGS